MTSITKTKIDFNKHAAAAVKVDRLREMIIDEAEALADPQAEILAQLKAVEIAVMAMFAPEGKTH